MRVTTHLELSLTMGVYPNDHRRIPIPKGIPFKETVTLGFGLRSAVKALSHVVETF